MDTHTANITAANAHCERSNDEKTRVISAIHTPWSFLITTVCTNVHKKVLNICVCTTGGTLLYARMYVCDKDEVTNTWDGALGQDLYYKGHVWTVMGLIKGCRSADLFRNNGAVLPGLDDKDFWESLVRRHHYIRMYICTYVLYVCMLACKKWKLCAGIVCSLTWENYSRPERDEQNSCQV